MNPPSRFLFTVSARVWLGFVSLVTIALLLCLPARTAQVKAQQPSWGKTGALGTAHFLHTTSVLASGNMLGDGDSPFEKQPRFRAAGEPASVAVADLNGDQKLAVVTANAGSGDVSVLLQQ